MKFLTLLLITCALLAPGISRAGDTETCVATLHEPSKPAGENYLQSFFEATQVCQTQTPNVISCAIKLANDRKTDSIGVSQTFGGALDACIENDK